MNCKPGDLAIQVYSLGRNEGKLYTVLEWRGHYVFLGGSSRADCWKVRCEQRTVGSMGIATEAGGTRFIPDSWLRPIRPDGITDEEVSELYAPKQPEQAQA